jgi:hypothetical protein
MSKGFDFNDLQIQEILRIQTPISLQFILRQDIITYFMRCLDLNINYTDWKDASFQFSIWGSSNTMQYHDLYEQIKEKFQDLNISRRDIILTIPYISLKCLDHNAKSMNVELLSELILSKVDINIYQLLDTRMTVDLKARRFYILYKEKQDESVENLRTLILGPLQSPKYVQVTEEFYSQSKQELKDHHELVFRAEMNADSSRRVELTLYHLKLFAKIDILYIL